MNFFKSQESSLFFLFKQKQNRINKKIKLFLILKELIAILISSNIIAPSQKCPQYQFQMRFPTRSNLLIFLFLLLIQSYVTI